MVVTARTRAKAMAPDTEAGTSHALRPAPPVSFCPAVICRSSEVGGTVSKGYVFTNLSRLIRAPGASVAAARRPCGFPGRWPVTRRRRARHPKRLPKALGIGRHENCIIVTRKALEVTGFTSSSAERKHGRFRCCHLTVRRF